MQNDILSIFEDSLHPLPIYICPGCNTVGKYEKKISLDTCTLIATPHLNNVNINKIHSNERCCGSFIMRITAEGCSGDKCDISCGIDLVSEESQKPQLANIIRVSEFVRDAKHTREVRFVICPWGYEDGSREEIPIQLFINDKISEIIKKVLSKEQITLINYLCLVEKQLPRELLNIIFKFTPCKELFGIMTI